MTKKDDYDVLDDLFDRHLNDEFVNDSINDFGRRVRDSINEEARRNGYDSLGDMIQGEINTSLNGTKKRPRSTVARTIQRKRTHYSCRYDYFSDALQDHAYLDRHRGYYREGHEEAIERYLELAQLNRNNLCALEKIVEEEIQNTSAWKNTDKRNEGYYDGLRFVQRCLLQSKAALMEEVNKELSSAMKKR